MKSEVRKEIKPMKPKVSVKMMSQVDLFPMQPKTGSESSELSVQSSK